jgi:hypothetical protein
MEELTSQRLEKGSAVAKQQGAPKRPAVGRSGQRPLLILVGMGAMLLLATIYHYAIYLPQPDQPHRLTILDDLFCLQLAGLIALLGLALGKRLLRWFRLPAFSRLEHSALAIGLGWGIISLFVLALGLAHLLYSWLLITLLGAALLLCWRDLWQLCRLLITPNVRPLLAPLFPASRFTRLLAIVALLNLPLVLLLTFLLPYYPRGYDVYQYHWRCPSSTCCITLSTPFQAGRTPTSPSTPRCSTHWPWPLMPPLPR